MFLQYAVLCDWAEETPTGYNLIGAKGVIHPAATQGERIRISQKLLVALLDVEAGQHTSWVVIKWPGREEPHTTAVHHSTWDEVDLVNYISMDIDIGVPGYGNCDFQILFDGTPIGVVSIPIVAAPT